MFCGLCGVLGAKVIDVSQDPAYWKAKDQDLHDIHYEIARRYHISRDDCFWLENIADDANLYLSERKLKPLIKKAIELLEKREEETKNANAMTEDEAKNIIEKVLATISRIYDAKFFISCNEIKSKYFTAYVSVWVYSGINNILGCRFYSYNDMFDSLFKHHSTIEFYDKDNNKHLVDLSNFGSTPDEINIACDLI